VEFGIFAELHDRASECALVVDDDIPVAEYVFERVDIHLDGIVLEYILQRLESGTGVFKIFGGNMLRFQIPVIAGSEVQVAQGMVGVIRK